MKKIIKYISLSILLLVSSCSEDSLDATGFGTITGTVVLKGSNEPVENVKIATNPNSNTVFTDASGNFVLSNIPSGQYSVEASKEGLLTSFEGVTVITNQSIGTIFEMLPETTTNTAPVQPNLLTPLDNTMDLDITVELTWESSDLDEDPLTYSIELRNDQNSTVQMIENITEPNYTLTDLSFGTQYFWQIGVSDGVNDIVWSNSQSFFTTTDPQHRFFFTRNIGGNDVIFSGEQDGEDSVIELQLTESSQNSWRPRKNNTIGRVAFLRSVGAETHIFSMLPDGSDIIQITNSIPVSGFKLSEVDFSWSTSGDKILYPSFDKLYSINNDGSGLTLVYQTSNGDFITECDWSFNGTTIALKTNNVNGYGASIYTIDMAGNVLTTVLSGINGAVGGINFSVDGTKLLYSHDISGFEDPSYRQLDTHVFVYDFGTTTSLDISASKPIGFVDVDPRFSPNEAEVICAHGSNDGISEKTLLTIDLDQLATRTELFTNAKMPDWE
ncbi:carboxypeptidase regulatory-like domain-containing protein [Pseudofulvibacter geojedonensis]|uniref:Carboxypeptidase regulatory-like domain-containing protein n=1 Tax=Pseudofulvibacter geojedonensis TaxID=1123758 RepID=A0ABW3I2N6_9FLAO